MKTVLYPTVGKRPNLASLVGGW